MIVVSWSTNLFARSFENLPANESITECFLFPLTTHAPQCHVFFYILFFYQETKGFFKLSTFMFGYVFFLVNIVHTEAFPFQAKTHQR